MTAHQQDPTPQQQADADALRAVLSAELHGTGTTPNSDAATPASTDSVVAPTRRPRAAAPLLDVMAAANSHAADAVKLLSVDSDDRISLQQDALASNLKWVNKPGEMAVYRDRSSTRLWLVPASKQCDCENCDCTRVASPSPRFVLDHEVEAPQLQSQCRLKLPGALLDQLHVGRTGQVLAIATGDALMLTSIAAVAGGLLADVGADAATATDSDAVASTNEDQSTQPTKPHLEAVA